MMMVNLGGDLVQGQIITHEWLEKLIDSKVEERVSRLLESLGIGIRSVDRCQMAQAYLTCKQAASLLGKTEQAIRNMVQRNQIPYIKKLGKLYFKEEDLNEWLEAGRRISPTELGENCEDALVINKNK